MTDSESHDHGDEASMNDAGGDRPDRLGPQECHETVDPETRAEVLDEYSHRCQVCGRRGPAEGGLATLHVHHIERDPDGMDEHDMENLTLLCRSCHSWFHQRSTPADAPVAITEADQTALLPQDIEILQYIADTGPARTGDIASGVPSELSVAAVRERLWVLMGLDNVVESRDRQIVDKDVETGEWGLAEQIENSARGHIPDDPQLLLQRTEDEQVRQALERGCDRSDIIDALGVSRRTTFNKEKRAYAYDFPLDAFSRGGRPSNTNRSEDRCDTDDTTVDESDTQQQLDVIPEQGQSHGQDQGQDSLGRTETWGSPEPTSETRAGGGVGTDQDQDDGVSEHGDDEEVRVHLQHAIAALQEVEQAL